MFVIPDLINEFTNNYFKNNLIENNLHNLINEYKMRIKHLRSVHKRVGLVCQNFLAVSLFEKEIDFLIFPSSVLESQVHREYASAFQNEIILEIKNDENIKHAKDFTLCATVSHEFMGIDHLGNVCKRISTGNNNISIIFCNLTNIQNKFESRYKNTYKYEENIKGNEGYNLKLFKNKIIK